MLTSPTRLVAALLDSKGVEHFFPLWPKVLLVRAGLIFLGHSLSLSRPASSSGKPSVTSVTSPEDVLSHQGKTLPYPAAEGHCSCLCMSYPFSYKADINLEAFFIGHGLPGVWDSANGPLYPVRHTFLPVYHQNCFLFKKPADPPQTSYVSVLC